MGLLNISCPKDRHWEKKKKMKKKERARGPENQFTGFWHGLWREVRECSQGQPGQACNWLTPEYCSGVWMSVRVCVFVLQSVCVCVNSVKQCLNTVRPNISLQPDCIAFRALICCHHLALQWMLISSTTDTVYYFLWAPMPNPLLPLLRYSHGPIRSSAWQLDWAPASFFNCPMP